VTNLLRRKGLTVPSGLYSVILGVILLLAAYRLFFYADKPAAVRQSHGRLIGGELCVRQFAEVTMRRLRAVVLAIAGLTLILSRR
jgi:hypothetical protein